jgi:hypothetical protein
LKDDNDTTVAALAVSSLLRQAREELSVKSIFAPGYWAPDGTWKYEVPTGSATDMKRIQDEDGDAGSGMQTEGGVAAASTDHGTEEIVFADVAAAHPLLKKWTALVDAEAARWKVDLNLLSREEYEAESTASRTVEEPTAKRTEVKATPRTREALEW